MIFLILIFQDSKKKIKKNSHIAKLSYIGIICYLFIVDPEIILRYSNVSSRWNNMVIFS